MYQVEIHISWTLHVPGPLTSILLCKALVVASVMHPCMDGEGRTGKAMPVVLSHTLLRPRASLMQARPPSHPS